MKNIIPVIFKHTVDMFHGTISWKIKRSFYRNFEKISAQLPVDLVTGKARINDYWKFWTNRGILWVERVKNAKKPSTESVNIGQSTQQIKALS